MDENQKKIIDKISRLDEMQQMYLLGFIDALLYKQELKDEDKTE